MCGLGFGGLGIRLFCGDGNDVTRLKRTSLGSKCTFLHRVFVTPHGI